MPLGLTAIRGSDSGKRTEAARAMKRILLRRRSPARLVLGGLGVLVGLQVVLVAVLTALAAWRKVRARPQGFPYEHLPETLVGENRLQVYGYGRELYDAMLSAID